MQQRCFDFLQEREPAIQGNFERSESIPARIFTDVSFMDRLQAFRTADALLQDYERSLFEGKRGLWMNDWVDNDNEELDVRIPLGLVFSVCETAWNDIVGIRLIHVVGDWCHCAETEGEPFVIGWQRGEEFLVRELDDEQARQLQLLCLEIQCLKPSQPQN